MKNLFKRGDPIRVFNLIETSLILDPETLKDLLSDPEFSTYVDPRKVIVEPLIPEYEPNI